MHSFNHRKNNPLPSIEKIYQYPSCTVKLISPDPEILRQDWQEGRLNHFPYWGKCWPAAMGLAEFITNNPSIVQDKQVLELAAGLGLPSLVTGGFAKKVMASDYLPEPLAYINKSADANGINNIETSIINWHHIPTDLSADIVLLSDVNYEPASFDALDRLIAFFLEQGTTIILSTPQRIMAKSFVEKWMPFRIIQEEFVCEDVRVSVLGMRKRER
jgi:predicted nicotinamide N-methyase